MAAPAKQFAERVIRRNWARLSALPPLHQALAARWTAHAATVTRPRHAEPICFVTPVAKVDM